MLLTHKVTAVQKYFLPSNAPVDSSVRPQRTVTATRRRKLR
jgi:hypothetical protein